MKYNGKLSFKSLNNFPLNPEESTALTPSTLSLDLILEILDLLAVPVHFHGERSDVSVLAACSTVCKEWSPHAQRLLFRRVILPARLPRGPHDDRRTRKLARSFLSAIDPATEHGRWLGESILATAMLRTPNLRHLDVTTAVFNSETLVQVQGLGARVKSLRVEHVVSRNLTHDSRIMQQIVACFPSIRILEIGGFDPVLAPFDPPLDRSLVCFKYHVESRRDIGPYLASLLNPNPDKSTALQVLSYMGTGLGLENVLNAHGTHLRSLTVQSFLRDSIAVTCPHLERFAMRRFPTTETLRLLPRSITALAMRGMPTTGADELNEFAQETESFPRLKTLAWAWCVSTYPPIAAVASVWQKRGMELHLSGKDDVGEDPLDVELRRKYIRI
ncbi:hypothetical protein DFH06DRAFT_1322017 [Mycena polygramma]|nr:hypothetical protein DFH06DRAFT_1322017 [Mycena polygramma]